MRIAFFVILSITMISCISTGPGEPEDAMKIDSLDEGLPEGTTGLRPEENPFVHAEGTKLISPEGEELYLRGIAFGNQVWSNPSLPSSTHHREEDYAYLASLGINSIRFYINYGLFESDEHPFEYKESGFAWLDKNIQWAREAGIYLILNMHVPQGGFQSQGDGTALWDIPENQDRLIMLWKEIARRYADEPFILGYDLLNEPVCSESTQQWENLARRTVRHIRTVDPAHIIVLERTNAVKGAWDENMNGQMNFFIVDDRNIMYEFHFYKPMDFTHQGAGWVSSLTDVRSVYPDPDSLEGNGVWAGMWTKNPSYHSTSEEWVYLEGVPYIHENPDWDYTSPALEVSRLGRKGVVNTDDILLTIKDPEGKLLQEIPLDMDGSHPGNWFYWSEDGSGEGEVSSSAGRRDSGLFAKGSLNAAVLSCHSVKILLQEGYSYQISGWVRGNKLTPGNNIKLRLDFYQAKGPVGPRTREWLREEMESMARFAREQNAPLYLGEFGCMRYAFEANRGGVEWVRDVIETAESLGIHYNYHTFHESAFGLFLNTPDELPAEKNTALEEVFRESAE